MDKLLKQLVFLLLISVFTSEEGFARVNQDENAAYTKVITARADKIVAELGISDSVKYKKVRAIMVNQYRQLNTFHEEKTAALKSLKEKHQENKAVLEPALKAMEADEERKLGIIHKEYISRLSAELDAAQITKVKDAMTYNVLPITYKAYQEMLPRLTVVQKEKILGFLTEAREHAMDASSSHAKHAWFGKYKGKINNYLSAEGIDMKQAGIEWQQRIKAEKAAGSKE